MSASKLLCYEINLENQQKQSKKNLTKTINREILWQTEFHISENKIFFLQQEEERLKITLHAILYSRKSVLKSVQLC